MTAQSVPAARPAIPLVVIGGYLGAGKTSLLNHVLTHAGERRITVLVNDFGSVNIDASLIRERSGDVISLENGCVCCSIGGRLVEALLAISARPEPPDLLLIEASGVSDPQRIAQIGLLDRGFRLNGIVVLVDAERIGETLADPYVGDIARRQVEGATALVLNKTDLIDGCRESAVMARLAGIAATRIVVRATRGAVPMEMLMDGVDTPFAPAVAARLPAFAPAHLPAGLRSFAFTTESSFDRGELKAALQGIGGHLLRAKGVVSLDGHAGPQELHVVGKRVLIGPFGTHASMNSTIVLIGLFDDGDVRRITRALESAMTS